MNATMRMRGVDKALKRLDREVVQKSKQTRAGLIALGISIQGSAQRRCPIDTGNLQNSAFTLWGERPSDSNNPAPAMSGPDASTAAHHHAAALAQEASTLGATSDNPRVEVGFTAAYAVFVHEDLAANHVKSLRGGGEGAVGEAKFLERAVDEYVGARGIAVVAGEFAAAAGGGVV